GDPSGARRSGGRRGAGRRGEDTTRYSVRLRVVARAVRAALSRPRRPGASDRGARRRAAGEEAVAVNEIAWFLIGLPVAVVGYTYVGYPLLLWLLSRRPPRPTGPVQSALSAEWPSISISVPVYNEEAQIRGLIESLLALDYPADRRQILIVSDASTDRTDEIVREYAGRGVELFRVPARGGKTAAENAAAPRLRGEIVVNTDASIRILPGSLKPLIASFADPEVGVASGRDVSVGRH